MRPWLSSFLIPAIIFVFWIFLTAPPLHAASYYLSSSGADTNPGTQTSPWKTLPSAAAKLVAGDILHLRTGTYTFPSLTVSHSGTSSAPITIKNFNQENVIITNSGPLSFENSAWWVIDGLTFENGSLGEHIRLGKNTTTSFARNITIRNCEIGNTTVEGIKVSYADDILIENCYFHHIRGGVSGSDGERHAIVASFHANNVIVQNNRFEDIGADGVHWLWLWDTPNASGNNLKILNNRFWINRPYTGPFGNLGENAIDIKYGNQILIANNHISGFYRTVPGQDVSGGGGPGITIHEGGVRNVVIEKNFFVDNRYHLTLEHNSTDVNIRNNIFSTSPASSQQEGIGILSSFSHRINIYHNTFRDNKVPLYFQSSTGIVLKNNAISQGQLQIDSASNLTADYNALFQISNTIPPTLHGSHDLLTSDLKLNSDFSLQSSSPLINAGTAVGVATDYTNRPRDSRPDIGAYEYGDSPLPTPTTGNPPPTSPPGCFTSSQVWQNFSLPSHQSNFIVEYDATPLGNQIDSLTMLGGTSTGTAYTDYAVLIRFNNLGFIDARNGAIYSAVNSIPYTANTPYHFKLQINTSAHTYSVWVTPPGSSPQLIADNFGFRTEQAAAANLTHWALRSSAGSHRVCNLTLSSQLNQSPSPTPVPFRNFLASWLSNLFDQNNDGKFNSLDFLNALFTP